jgi:hypothetical protein
MLSTLWVRGSRARWRMVTTALAVVMTAGVAVAARADTITDDTVGSAIVAAKTPEDHAALAQYFTSKAEAATASAEKHDTMAKGFEGKAGERMAAHCKSLAAADRKQAADYTALAKAQEKLAHAKK